MPSSKSPVASSRRRALPRAPHPRAAVVPAALASALATLVMIGCDGGGDASAASPPAAGTATASPSPSPSPPPPVPVPLPKMPVADVKTTGEAEPFHSQHLQQPLLLLPGVFPPGEAELYVLPFMKDHPQLFAGKRVYEIGTGSGMISLYAAQLGATQVVCTDISEAAIACVRQNAERMGFAEIVEARLVPPHDLRAFSVLRDGEVFDTIISNPPYGLDLDAEHNTALVDKGDLGPTILKGLPRHLAPDGHAALFYNTLFYHGVMVKLAQHLGFDVRSHMALGVSPWEFEAIFNQYLGRLLEREGMDRNAFRFWKEELPYALAIDKTEPRPLIGDGDAAAKVYRGFMVVRHGQKR